MSDVKDYTGEYGDSGANNHYRGVPSMYGKLVSEQQRQQPKYSEPGPAGGGQKGAHRRTQKGA